MTEATLHTAHTHPGGSAGKESACNAGDLGSIRELGFVDRDICRQDDL